MTYKYTLEVNTDGIGFVDYDLCKELTGIKLIKMRDGCPQLFQLFEGIWYLSVDTRITVKYNDTFFYDVDSKENIPSGWVILEEISLPGDMYVSYKLTCITFKEVLDILSKDISLLEKGNILSIYNKLQMYDWIYDD